MSRRRSARATSRRRLLAPLVTAALSLALTPLGADAQFPRGVQWGGRLDAIGARAPSVQGGVTVNVPAGLYVRLDATLAAGVAGDDGVVKIAARSDAAARFLLDPFAESRYALYGIGGVSVMYDAFEEWRPRLLVGAGIDGPAVRGRVIAFELALGGGVRAGVVVRRTRLRGR